ncbi:MAG: TIGR03905 family TSCPD domain-containing protein [Christensenellales bacterium]|nr:TIGR03905 family TSCPD domain-containing protein [Clostridium sp.]MDY2925884.1 TIGR03905 family TSCPD domain-containing protein [Eubacteriales bacterium]MCI6817931.1 TIGR03905 family TSCPD domain-containing protein [Clostridium sp.]MCI6986812.1 TIGR03905 family TSCPD domain-containing protein [Clostridium sp.]MCI7013394.1 TIGR03905 family TSCPD domain-containing protein [Clostridium sp.]
MHYTYKTNGTCSSMIDFDIVDGKLHNITYTGGCNGNLKAIGSILEGADAKFAVERLSGIRCGFKDTSCGDQLARAIREAIAANKD